jgi:DNA-binding response OmpR family regulator
MDSFAVCKHLHDSYGIPVIVVGNVTDGEMWKQTVDAGGDCYIREPVSCRGLAARMSAILRRYKGRKLMESA